MISLIRLRGCKAEHVDAIRRRQRPQSRFRRITCFHHGAASAIGKDVQIAGVDARRAIIQLLKIRHTVHILSGIVTNLPRATRHCRLNLLGDMQRVDGNLRLGGLIDERLPGFLIRVGHRETGGHHDDSFRPRQVGHPRYHGLQKRDAQGHQRTQLAYWRRSGTELGNHVLQLCAVAGEIQRQAAGARKNSDAVVRPKVDQLMDGRLAKLAEIEQQIVEEIGDELRRRRR